MSSNRNGTRIIVLAALLAGALVAQASLTFEASPPVYAPISPPVINEVAIAGNPIVGQVLTGYYTFSGGSDFSVYRWRRSATADGAFIPIEGTTGQITYTLTLGDMDSYIRFEVVPMDEGGSGVAVMSDPVVVYVPGDFNGDGTLSGLDIPSFKQALADPDGWALANPHRPHPSILGDFNGDGAFSGLDIPGFKQALAVVTPPITWVTIVGNPGFNGQMSRYETTNAQYAQYLNAALATGDIYTTGHMVRGAIGSNPGTDYESKDYYRRDGGGSSGAGASSGGKSRIVFSNGVFSVESGFENHPVTYVSWYGAMAFASFYGWRLPTADEWQAVASFNGAYTYGSGNALYDSVKFLANYRANGDYGYSPNLPFHPYVQHGTTPVGYFGTFGCGMADMAGNVREWTSTAIAGHPYHRIVRGGGWSDLADVCAVSYGIGLHMESLHVGAVDVGFRVCR